MYSVLESLRQLKFIILEYDNSKKIREEEQNQGKIPIKELCSLYDEELKTKKKIGWRPTMAKLEKNYKAKEKLMEDKQNVMNIIIDMNYS